MIKSFHYTDRSNANKANPNKTNRSIMRKYLMFLIAAILIIAGIKIAANSTNTENTSSHSTGGDHLYHMSVIIKEIDSERKKFTTEVIDEDWIADVGEQLIIDMSNASKYGHQRKR